MKLLNKLESQKLAGSAGVAVAVWVQIHCSLCVLAAQSQQPADFVGGIADSVEVNRAGMSATVNCAGGGTLADGPTAGNLWQIKRGENKRISAVSLVEPVPAQTDGVAGHFESGVVISVTATPTGVYLAIDSAAGQAAGEPFGSVHAVSVARPEMATVPFYAATVELFAGLPADETLPGRVNCQQHVALVNHGLNKDRAVFSADNLFRATSLFPIFPNCGSLGGGLDGTAQTTEGDGSRILFHVNNKSNRFGLVNT